MNIEECYGENVFDNRVMKNRLPKETYNALKSTIRLGADIDLGIANVVANVMKEWAIEKGATHYTHWFQPMTGSTAEKHDSFICPQKDGSVIMEFSGKELIKGEPDASSFPSGGLRATFEARGYTAWDPTSFAFIKEGTLCIPTAFCSYSGAVLDKKTPLLKSMEVINTQALRVLKALGKENVKHVDVSVGLEQEYFLVDKEIFNKRRDLKLCGRTLLGAKPPKGQELNDHYFGAIRPRVKEFMKTLNEDLWKFGIPAKTEHNETAPAQHELASVYSSVNLSVDRNLLIMEEMKKLAEKAGLACLLHEKPFDGINGSGKHNNWSLVTDEGENLLDVGESLEDYKRFLVFLCAVISAVDNYQDLLSASIASPSNDCRLGGNEAPPRVSSVFLGEELTEILNHLGAKKTGGKNKEEMTFGVHVLPNIPKDISDRNRTSPVAFTGNKFEFRMVGSKLNASDPNVVINTAVADSLAGFAEILEKKKDSDKAVAAIVEETVKKHGRIIFNGNCYAKEWHDEAKRRGLFSFDYASEAFLALCKEKNVNLFVKYGIFTREELESRMAISLENYCKTLNIEALTMLEMLKKEVIPAVTGYSAYVANGIKAKKDVLSNLSCVAETKMLKNLESGLNGLLSGIPFLEEELREANNAGNFKDSAEIFNGSVLPGMKELRTVADGLEEMTAASFWPYPTIEELLFSV